MTGYYDSESAEKCSKISEQHEKFYTDLKERRQKSNEHHHTYTDQLNSLVSQYQEKITQHSNKFQAE